MTVLLKKGKISTFSLCPPELELIMQRTEGSFPPYPTRLACSLKRKTFTYRNLSAVVFPEDELSTRATVCYDLAAD